MDISSEGDVLLLIALHEYEERIVAGIAGAGKSMVFM
jgi:hypothetical protein